MCWMRCLCGAGCMQMGRELQQAGTGTLMRIGESAPLALERCTVSHASSTDSAVLYTLLPSTVLSGGSWQPSSPGRALKDLGVTLASTKIFSICRGTHSSALQGDQDT